MHRRYKYLCYLLMYYVNQFMFTGGRRNGVTLPHILQFTTGAPEEPVLGFIINPSIACIH